MLKFRYFRADPNFKNTNIHIKMVEASRQVECIGYSSHRVQHST